MMRTANEHVLATMVLAFVMAGCSRTPDAARDRAADPAHSEAAATTSQPDPLIDRRLLFGNPARTQGRISPDGQWVSFLAPVGGVLNVWVAPLGEVDAARPVTDATGRGIRQHYWSESGGHLLYLNDTGGDEDYHLFAVDLAGAGDARDLTPFERTRALLIGTSADRPQKVVVGLNNRDPRLHDPYVLDVTTGELELIERNERFVQYVTDNALALRLALAQRPDGGQDILRRTPEGWSEFGVIPQADTRATRFLEFDRTNTTVLMLDSRGRDTAALIRLSLEDGARTVLLEDPRADVTQVLIDPATHEVLAAGADFERLEWHPVADDMARDLARLRLALGPDWQFLSASNDGARWVVADNRPESPLTYYVYARPDRSLSELFVTRPELIAEPLAPMVNRVITSRDGLSLVSYLTLPRWTDPDGDGRPAEPLPMMLWVHGGPWARDEFGYDTYHQWFANRGYAVLSVNYRGSTGFGKQFLNAGNLEWAARMHDDLIDAVRWAVDGDIAKPDQVAIGGGSYGGYATLVGLTFTPEQFACGVDIVGPSHLQTLLASIPPYWEPILNEFAARMGDPRTEDGRKLLEERSPLNHVEAIRRPLLIGQGANDPRVKQAESDQIVAAMQTKQLPVTYVLFPDEGHGFARPENSLAFNAIAENFLTGCLGGRAQPIGDALAGSSTSVPAGVDFVPGLEAALDGFEPTVRK